MKVLILSFSLLALFLTKAAFGEGKGKKDNVIYKYKKYERIDLGDMEVQGNIVAPGDLSVKQRRRRVFKRTLYTRPDFNKEAIKDLTNLR